MDKRIKQLNLTVILFFLLIVLNLTYLQIIAADKIAARPENKRVELKALTVEPGSIYSADGLLLARPFQKGEFYFHAYPQGELASHLIGFFSPRFGKMGLEQSHQSFLFPQPELTGLEQFLQLPGVKEKGSDLVLTIDSSVQKKAEELLGGRRGAIIALDPRSGQVIALASSPQYAPNLIESRWEQVRSDPSNPLFNRALSGLYPPGSTFKIITASAALEKKVASPDSAYDGPAELKVNGSKVTNFKDQGFGAMSLSEAFSRSCNTIFAQVGLRVGKNELIAVAESFGLNHPLPFDLPVKTSRIRPPGEMDEVELAWTAVGQGRLLITPMQMALITAAIANNGSIMKPYLIKEIRDPEGEIIKETRPEVWRQAISRATAREMSGMMEEVVTRGTGRRASLPGIRVAGKTGTAETAEKKNHAWFVGFAPADDPRVVVVVLIEEGGIGGSVAAPLAGDLLKACLK